MFTQILSIPDLWPKCTYNLPYKTINLKKTPLSWNTLLLMNLASFSSFSSPSSASIALLARISNIKSWSLTPNIAVENTQLNIYIFVTLPAQYCMPSVLRHCCLGGKKGIRPVKNWVVRCWHGYLSIRLESVNKQLMCRYIIFFKIKLQKYSNQISNQTAVFWKCSSNWISKGAEIAIWILIAIGIWPSLPGVKFVTTAAYQMISSTCPNMRKRSHQENWKHISRCIVIWGLSHSLLFCECCSRYTLCPKKVSPLNILQQPPQTCTDFNEILHTQDDIYLCHRRQIS